MNRYAILQQDYTQKALVTPRNSYPNANPAREKSCAST